MPYKSFDCFFTPLVICPCRFNPANPSENIHHLADRAGRPGQQRANARQQHTEKFYFCCQYFERITLDCKNWINTF